MIMADVKSFGFRIKCGIGGCCGVTIEKMSFPYFFLSPNDFSCHSRENGNPEFRFRVKHGITRGQCGMTGKTMSPHT